MADMTNALGRPFAVQCGCANTGIPRHTEENTAICALTKTNLVVRSQFPLKTETADRTKSPTPHRYTPYSRVKSNHARIFSGLASSNNAAVSMMYPPSLPQISISFRT